MWAGAWVWHGGKVGQEAESLIKFGHPHRWNRRGIGRAEAENLIRIRHPEQKKKVGVYATVPIKKQPNYSTRPPPPDKKKQDNYKALIRLSDVCQRQKNNQEVKALLTYNKHWACTSLETNTDAKKNRVSS